MTQDAPQLTAKQQAFIAYYVKYHNATRAARLAGYEGDDNTLGVTGFDLLRNPNVKGEIERLFRERLASPSEVLDLINTTAKFDPEPYLKDDLSLDVRKMGKDGLGIVIEGVKPGRYGPEVTLASPQTARKLLAQHHRLLQHLDIDVSTTVSTDPGVLDALVGQLTAAQKRASMQQDATQDDTE